jgi:hypothetical protein
MIDLVGKVQVDLLKAAYCAEREAQSMATFSWPHGTEPKG